MKTTEILGTNGLNESRITINQNFRMCEDAINEINRLVQSGEASSVIGSENTTLMGSTLNLGGVVLTREQLQALIELLPN